jgi:hypothetical protein
LSYESLVCRRTNFTELNVSLTSDEGALTPIKFCGCTLATITFLVFFYSANAVRGISREHNLPALSAPLMTETALTLTLFVAETEAPNRLWDFSRYAVA